MAANADSTKSTMATNSNSDHANSAEGDLPVVEVSTTSDGVGLVVKLVFNGDEEDSVEYGADTTIDSHAEINSITNSTSNRPRGKNMRALLTCGGGTLVWDSQEYTVSVEPRKKAGQPHPGESPGAIAHPSRSRRAKIIEFLFKTCADGQQTLCIHGEVCSTKESDIDQFETYLTAKPYFDSARTRIAEALQLPPSGQLSGQPIDVDFSQLQLKTESAFQTDDFQKGFFNLSEAKALDLHSSNQGTPFFLPCQQSADSQRVYYRDGKPDGVSTATPMEIEIKTSIKNNSDAAQGKVAHGEGGKPGAVCWEVLLQAIERVVVRMNLSGYVRNAVAFAVSDKSAWVVIGNRSIPDGLRVDTHPFSVAIERIEYSDVSKIWMAVTQKAASGPLFIQDGAEICHVLRCLDIEAANCRVRWIGSSMSTVYKISVGKPMKKADTMTFGIDVASSGYALKIVRDETAFKAECQALVRLSKKFSDFYALALVRKDGQVTKLFDGESTTPSTLFSQFENVWWRETVSCDDDFAGAIFMQLGLMWDGKNSEDVVDGVMTALAIGHQAGVYHCDLREANIASFNGQFRPIDYSLSVLASAPTIECSEITGEQKKNVGARVRGCIENGEESIVWTKRDDYEMVVKLFAGMQSSTRLRKRKVPSTPT